MQTLTKLKRLQKDFSFCGTEEDFTNFCFLNGQIVSEYKNEVERNIIFNVNGVITEVVIINGVTHSTKIY